METSRRWDELAAQKIVWLMQKLIPWAVLAAVLGAGNLYLKVLDSPPYPSGEAGGLMLIAAQVKAQKAEVARARFSEGVATYYRSVKARTIGRLGGGVPEAPRSPEMVRSNEGFKIVYVAMADWLRITVAQMGIRGSSPAPLTNTALRNALDIAAAPELFGVTSAQATEMRARRTERGAMVGAALREALTSTVAYLGAASLTGGSLQAVPAGFTTEDFRFQQALYRTLSAQYRKMVDEADAFFRAVAMEVVTRVDPELERKLEKERIELAEGTGVLRWAKLILKAAAKYEVDPALVAAVMDQESGGNPDAVSQMGAIGLMQLMPGTARLLGVNPYDPEENIEGGVHYLSLQLQTFRSLEKALAAYNAGPGNAGRWREIPETFNYVQRVPRLVTRYREAFDGRTRD